MGGQHGESASDLVEVWEVWEGTIDYDLEAEKDRDMGRGFQAVKQHVQKP